MFNFSTFSNIIPDGGGFGTITPSEGKNHGAWGEKIRNYISENKDKYKYKIPQEALDILGKTQESADYLRQSSGEMLGVAESQRNFAEAPGTAGFNANLAQAESNTVGNVVGAGGSSISSMGAINQTREATIGTMRDAAIQSQMLRDQKETEYKEALLDKGSAEIAASQLEVGGMQEMLRQREQEFQVNVLDPYYNKVQKELVLMGAEANKKASVGEQLKSALPWNW